MGKSFLKPWPMPLRLPQRVISKTSRSNRWSDWKEDYKQITTAASTHEDPKKSPQPTKMHKEIYVLTEKRQQIIDEIWLL